MTLFGRVAKLLDLRRTSHALHPTAGGDDDTLLRRLLPLGWEHVNLTGNYIWRRSVKVDAGKLKPLRPRQPA